MLKRTLLAGALLCAPVHAVAGSYWEDQLGIHPQIAPSPRSRHSHRAARVHRDRVSVARGASLAGVYAPLAAKALEIVQACGSRVSSGVRKTYVAGTGRRSMHWNGHAVDMVGNYPCIYSHLAGWPGGVSTDAVAARHVHFSLGGPEDGRRFAHRILKRTRLAWRRHGRQG